MIDVAAIRLMLNQLTAGMNFSNTASDQNKSKATLRTPNTAICPFSTRTKSGAFVAMPVSWPALARLASAHPVEVGEAAAFARGRDPWPGYFTLKQKLPKL